MEWREGGGAETMKFKYSYHRSNYKIKEGYGRLCFGAEYIE